MIGSAKAYRCPSCGAPKSTAELSRCSYCETLSYGQCSMDEGKSQVQLEMEQFYSADLLSNSKERMTYAHYNSRMTHDLRRYELCRNEVEEIKRRLNFGKEVYA